MIHASQAPALDAERCGNGGAVVAQSDTSSSASVHPQNENPGALAGATGAIGKRVVKTAEYRARAEAATSLCLSIAACIPQDAVIIIAAALADLVGQVVV